MTVTSEEDVSTITEVEKLNTVTKYQEAMAADKTSGPCTLKPFRNMTAVYFELGRYTQCREKTKQVVELIQEMMPEDKAVLAKLAQRIERSIEHIPKSLDQQKFDRRLKISMSLPRYHASLVTTTEYFTVGHDVPESLSYELMQKLRRDGKDRTLSFFFGGIGDARNLYTTMIDLHASEKKGIAPLRKYHFVANDINKCALTRNLIIWKLLDDLSTLSHDSDEGMMALATIFFIYEANIMPNYIHEYLSAIMEKILVILQENYDRLQSQQDERCIILWSFSLCLKHGNSPLEWVSLHASDMAKYIGVLYHWLNKSDEGSYSFTTSEAMRGIREELSDRPHFLDEHFKKEKQIYVKYGVLRPPEKILMSREPRLSGLIKTPSKSTELRKYIEKSWKFNPTMMDSDWYDYMQRRNRSEEFDWGNDPFEAFHKGRKPSSLFDHVAPFFQDAADALKKLKGRFHVEVLCGDIIDISEWFRFGTSSTRFPRSGEFPTEFDGIHLSNIQDYIGGNLSTFLYITPLLKKEATSFVRSNCLRNSGNWKSIEAFFADYQCITNKTMLKQLTGMEVMPRPFNHAQPISEDDWSALLPRSEFQRWFYALFFKPALPYNVNIFNPNTVIFSPLNLTILFRLMDQLRSRHYPSHWMSEILSNIIENKVNDANICFSIGKQHKARNLCTAPFSHEMATLTQMFMPLLPFSLESSAIPAQNDIYRYTFPFPSVISHQELPNTLILVFWSLKYFMDLGEMGSWSFINDLRPLLDPTWGDEMDSRFRGSKSDTFRQKGLIVWSTMEWDVEAQEAIAWMPGTLVNKMIRQGDWNCGLFRTDTWQRCWQKPLMMKDVRRDEVWEE
ncbi:hypothetical protein BOTNAR_0017g00340 [Botryotinia narcissicola]|uniref:DUF4470 domain-containing protein n=1 Tax=Botryotinia narcissicola TaxID=278944 RepID=A0A4Z1J5U9_9HELO|nr:hypothetical protein BOTNAR_0017g00340 [Botryotinia narcissicola]